MPRTTERARVLKQLQLLQHNSQPRRQKWLARRAQQQRSQHVYASTEPNDSKIDTDSGVSGLCNGLGSGRGLGSGGRSAVLKVVGVEMTS